MPLKTMMSLKQLVFIKDTCVPFLHKAKRILTDPLLCDLSLLEKPSLMSNPQTSTTLSFLFY